MALSLSHSAGTTKEHIGLAMALQVPIFVVVSKIDLCPAGLIQRTLDQLTRLLSGPGCKKVPYRVESDDNAVTAARSFNTTR